MLLVDLSLNYEEKDQSFFREVYVSEEKILRIFKNINYYLRLISKLLESRIDLRVEARRHRHLTRVDIGAVPIDEAAQVVRPVERHAEHHQVADVVGAQLDDACSHNRLDDFALVHVRL